MLCTATLKVYMTPTLLPRPRCERVPPASRSRRAPSGGSSRQRRQQQSLPICAAHGPRELPPTSKLIVEGWGVVGNQVLRRGGGQRASGSAKIGRASCRERV